MEPDTGSLRLVVFPWLASDHIHPFLELAKSLAMRGHHVTFISTPRNIQRLPRIPPDLSSLVTFVPLTLPRVEPLPETAESTTDIPTEHVQYLKKAFDGLAEPFTAFLELACSNKITKPDWVIMDSLHHWLPKIAKAFGVPCAFFSVYPACSLAFFGPPSEYIDPVRTEIEDFTQPPCYVPFCSNVAFRPHQVGWVLKSLEHNESDISIMRRMYSVITECEFVCIRTCFEIEPAEWLSLLAELYEKDVVPVGLLPPQLEDISSTRETSDSELDQVDVIDWLDKHPPKSVLYVALRSESVEALSTELLHELALGLEKSAVPFLWSLRIPAGWSGSAADMLPAGFQERINGTGHVAFCQVPQTTILAHASVGGFLTDCSPGSVIESMQFGHPLLMLPLIFDQGLIAGMLDESGVALELYTDEAGKFKRERVASDIRHVMVNEVWRSILCSTAEQFRPIFTDKVSQKQHLNSFIKRLQKHNV